MPETAAAVSEHRVELVQEFDLVLDGADRDLHGLGQILDILFFLGQELVQRRIEQADGDRQPLHLAEDADEITLLHGQDLGQGLLAPFQLFGQDHLTHGRDPLGIEEHMLGAAEADPFGAEFAGHLGVMGGIGIGADLQSCGTCPPTPSACRNRRSAAAERSAPRPA